MFFEKISIIVPVYNVETYLECCIESILKQTYTNIELLLIDDGSSDNSGLICDKYVSYDSRCIVIHQSNEGVSVARNKGLSAATGDWITFIDADDYIESDTFELLMIEINKKKDIGIIQYGCVMENENGKVLKQRLLPAVEFSIPNQFEYFEPSNCYKIIKRNIIFDNNICFKPGITLSEDRLFAFECYLNCFLGEYVCANINRAMYHYIQHTKSSTHNMTETNLNHEIEVIRIMEKEASDLKIDTCEWNEFIQEQKVIAKNHAIFLLATPRLDLWRSLFPEVSDLLLKDVKRRVLYKSILLKRDKFALFILFINRILKKIKFN